MKSCRIETFNKIRNKFPEIDFSKFVHYGKYEESIIICPIHGEVMACFNRLNTCKTPCPLCDPRGILSEENKIISLNYKLKYIKDKFKNLDFSKFNVVDKEEKSIVICKEHGDFLTSVSYMMDKRTKYGCPKCSGNIKYDTGQARAILSKVHPNLDFSKFEYKEQRVPSTVICPKHGEFQAYFFSLRISKIGCHRCAVNRFSTPEKEIVDYIKSIYSNTIIENDRSVIPSIRNNKYFMELDIYLPDINLAIEFNGSYWHSDEFISKRTNGVFKTAKEYHDYKLEKCNEKGIKLIFIEEQDYRNNKVKILKEIKHNIL